LTLGRSDKALGRETSRTLDYLLTGSGYNKRIRPQFGGDPIQVPQPKNCQTETNHHFIFTTPKHPLTVLAFEVSFTNSLRSIKKHFTGLVFYLQYILTKRAIVSSLLLLMVIGTVCTFLVLVMINVLQYFMVAF
jgi:hypothetical protein